MTQGEKEFAFWTGVACFAFACVGSCVHHENGYDADLKCYQRAQIWQHDRDVGSFVAVIVKDKKITNGECSDLVDLISVTKERRKKTNVLHEMKVL
jgi:hypothetical protein